MAKYNDESKGKITCERSILSSIVNLATKEINGVAGMARQEGLLNLISNTDDGVKIRFDSSGTLLIDVYINVYMNVSVPDIAFKVQENIRNSLATMVALKPLKINVHVINVDIPREDAL